MSRRQEYLTKTVGGSWPQRLWSFFFVSPVAVGVFAKPLTYYIQRNIGVSCIKLGFFFSGRFILIVSLDVT